MSGQVYGERSLETHFLKFDQSYPPPPPAANKDDSLLNKTDVYFR